MRRLIPNFSDLFAAWVSAGQYSSVEELELDTDVQPSNKIRLFPGKAKSSASAANDSQQAKQAKVRWG